MLLNSELKFNKLLINLLNSTPSCLLVLTDMHRKRNLQALYAVHAGSFDTKSKPYSNTPSDFHC